MPALLNQRAAQARARQQNIFAQHLTRMTRDKHLTTPKALFLLTTALSLCFTSSASAQARREYAPYEALRKGSPCTVTFSAQTLDVCGQTIRPEEIRGWYVYGGTFAIYDQKLNLTAIEFIDAYTLRSFAAHLTIWSGKDPVSF